MRRGSYYSHACEVKASVYICSTCILVALVTSIKNWLKAVWAVLWLFSSAHQLLTYLPSLVALLLSWGIVYVPFTSDISFPSKKLLVKNIPPNVSYLLIPHCQLIPLNTVGHSTKPWSGSSIQLLANLSTILASNHGPNSDQADVAYNVPVAILVQLRYHDIQVHIH